VSATAPAPPFTGELLPEVRQALIGVSDYLHGATTTDGRLVCAEHRLDHTGRSSRSIVIDCALHAATGDDRYFQRALSRALTTDARLAPDPEHGAWIFHPGRLDPNNMSTSVIDGGDCVDALATFLLQFADRVDDDLRERLEATIARHCDTYLANAAVTKEVTNQRLWGAMGLASAYRLTGKDARKDAVMRSLEVSFGDQNPDGSFSYHPTATEHGLPAGAGGASVYYQSRHLAFAHHARVMCDEPEAFAAEFERGIDFLLAAITPEGFKPLVLDSKPWFWQGPLEAGSHPYDLYAIAALAPDGSSEDVLANLTGRLFETRDEDGAFRGVPAGGRGFNCRHFHTADLAWLARAAELTPLAPDPAPAHRLDEAKPRVYSDAGLIRLQTAEACALIAVAPGPRNLLYGARAGGGELVYLGRRRDGWRNRVERWSAPDREIPGWFTPAGSDLRSNLDSYLRHNRPGRDLRFRLYTARTRLKSGRPFDSLRALFADLRAEAAVALAPVAHSRHWPACGVEVVAGGIQIEAGLAGLGGEPFAGLTLRRRYELAGDRLLVDETLTARDCNAPITYRPPPGARDLLCEPDCDWDTSPARITCHPRGAPATVRIRFEL
jgi:hypothetical protein